MDLMSFPSQPRRGLQLDDIMTGLGMLGNVLALPHTVEAQQTENEQMRALLAGSGIPEEQIKAATPEPALRWLSPKQGGFTGKLLGGVGDVGAILSTVVGKPVKAPRMGLDEIAAASRMRSENAKAAAQKHLQDVIADPNATDQDIGRAAVAAGSVEGGLRYLRGNRDQRMPSSILGLRGYINSLPPGDPRRAQAQETLDDALQAEKERADEAQRRAQENADRHYLTPGQQEDQRRDAIERRRDQEARDRGYQPGSPEYKYYKDHGYDPPVRQPKSDEELLNEEITREQRRRDALLTKDRKDEIPNEPVEVTARRTLAERKKAAGEQKAGAPLPAPAPSLSERRQQLRAGVTAGMLGAREGGTPTSTTTTTTTQPPTSTTQPSDSDAAALDVLRGFDFDALPDETKQQVLAARDAGMPLWPLANWLSSLQPSPPPR